jgi:hypothetical protein
MNKTTWANREQVAAFFFIFRSALWLASPSESIVLQQDIHQYKKLPIHSTPTQQAWTSGTDLAPDGP